MNELNQIVVFRLNSELYGISISDVKEIVKMQNISKLPQTAKHVEGMTNLRGNIHVIHNLRIKFNMENKEVDDRTKIIVLNDKNVGFIVDEVEEIINISEENISSVDNLPHFTKNNHLSGIVRFNDKLITAINTRELFKSEVVDAAVAV